MAKQKLTLSLDKSIIKKAKEKGLCISTFLEVKLVDYFTRSEIEWACCDLNASLWLPKPQGYQATPQARMVLHIKKKKQIKEFSVKKTV